MMGFILIISCKKNSVDYHTYESLEVGARSSNLDFSITTPLISLDEIRKISLSLLDEDGNLIQDSAAIAERIAPLVEAGRKLHDELLTNILKTASWEDLTEAEKYSVVNFSEVQMAELALVYSACNPNDADVLSSADWGRIRNCLSAALGLGDLYYLVVQNPKALLSASGATKILKHVGLRYLGYIGLILAVVDFVDCVSS